jgi:predicted RNA-binding Zn ribbon-like protein
MEATGTSHSQPAPGELELVRAFVNTRDIEEDIDEVASPSQLRAWLSDRGLLSRSGRVTPAGVERARRLREGLRELLLANNGAPVDRRAVRELNAISERAPLSVRFGADGSGVLKAVPGDVDGAIARLLGVVAGAMADGTWPRLKACRDDTCQWAFYDTSKNRSGTWCSMAVCGNRAKARAYRARNRGARATARA